MPRKIRFIIPNVPHHAIQRGNNRQDVFRDYEDRNYYLSVLRESSKEKNVLIGAYCLMTNHIHLLLYPRDEKGLIGVMKHVSQLYTQYFNRKYKRTGKLWENRYKLYLGDPDRAWVIARYIERNPMRARMVLKAEDFAYSSAKAHLLGASDELLTYDILENDRNAYREFFNQSDADAPEHVREIENVAQQGKALGDEDFHMACKEILGVDLEVRDRGRPRLVKK